MNRLGLLATLLFISQLTFAKGEACRHLFEVRPATKTIPGLYDKGLESFEDHQNIKLLAEKLFLVNRQAISFGDYSYYPELLKTDKISIKTITLDLAPTKSDHYGTYNCMVKIENSMGRNEFNISIRSNGKVAFIDKTWMFRKDSEANVKKYQAVYFEGDAIKSADQGEIILNSLPEMFQISRNLGSKERNRWLNGEPYFPSLRYGNRVHFMPNTSRFDKRWEPYTINISKKDLLDFYHRGELEINIYENHSHMNLTDIKLHFELVFMGDEGIKNLAPYMQSQLINQDKSHSR
jgi:hypothetical protein